MDTLSKTVNGLLAISLVPFVILNFASGIVGGVWLLFLGEWLLVVQVILLSIFVPFAQTILLLPTIPIGMLTIYFFDKSRMFIGGTLAFINMFYVQAIGLGWAILVFLGMLTLANGGSFPYLLLGYSMAAGPYSYMASKEGPDALGSFVAVWLVQFTYVTLVLFYYLGILPLALPLIVIVTIVIEIWLVKMALMVHEAEQERDRFFNTETYENEVD